VVLEGTPGVVEPAASWGGATGLEPFGLAECWALRRGRAHVVEDRDEGPRCKHLASIEGSSAMCVPMMAHGSLLGVFSLVVRDPSSLTDPRQRLVMTVAEHVSLALANLTLQESLRSQSIRDPLTGLFNRRYMEESLEREMRRAVRNRASVGIIMLDIDHFKAFNDMHGHDAGDALLRAIGSVLQRSIRAEDIACRYGGEEFTLILPDASLHEAAQRAEYLRQAVKQLVVPHRRQTLAPVSLSAGVAIFPDHGPTADAVLRAADTALYQAKARGRDRVVLNQTGGLFPDGIIEFGRRT
jgi:diguanylate cyclase (GGDEF)-like protein